MPFDRSKFQGVAPEIIKAQQAKMQELNPFSSRKGFVKLTPGSNTLRIYPAHRIGAQYAYPKVVSWLPFFEEQEDKKTKQKIQVEVRKPIFNSRYHAGPFDKLAPKDLVEEYISFGFKLFEDEIQDETEREKKLKPLIDWSKGLKPQIAWVFYGKKVKSDGTKEFGRVEITNGLMDKFNKIAARTSSTGQPMTIDVFSHPDTGKAVQVMWNKDEPDNKKKYEPTLLFELDWKLTDEELAEFAELESLEDIYTNCFTRSDFQRQVQGLQNFDDKHGYGFFSHDEFIETCEEISAYLEANVFPTTDAKTPTEFDDDNTTPFRDTEPAKESITEPIKEKLPVEPSNTGTVKTKTTGFKVPPKKVTAPAAVDEKKQSDKSKIGSFREKYGAKK